MIGDETQFEWQDVQRMARDIFKVWTSNGDLHWAQTAWAILGEHGLTGRNDEAVDDFVTVGRLVALGLFYCTFASIAWDEDHSEPNEWFGSHPELADVDVLRLLSPEWYDEFAAALSRDSDTSDRESGQIRRQFVQCAWDELLESEYTRVIAALRNGFGGDGALFVSLWCTPDGRFSGWRRFPDAVRDNILNSDVLSGNKLRAYEWLCGGAQYQANW